MKKTGLNYFLIIFYNNFFNNDANILKQNMTIFRKKKCSGKNTRISTSTINAIYKNSKSDNVKYVLLNYICDVRYINTHFYYISVNQYLDIFISKIFYKICLNLGLQVRIIGSNQNISSIAIF